MNKSSIAKYSVGALIVIAFVGYAIFANQNSTPTTVATTPVTNEPTSTDTGAGSTSTSTSTTPATTGQYKDGTYTGSVADAFYGNLQVKAVISGGMITDVQFVQAPSGGESSQISARAESVLKQEAIASQSANVNTVSGATQDSAAFNQSLASALAQAKS